MSAMPEPEFSVTMTMEASGTASNTTDPTRVKVTKTNRIKIQPQQIKEDIEKIVNLHDEDMKKMLRGTLRMGCDQDVKVVARESIVRYLEGVIQTNKDCMMVPFVILFSAIFCVGLLLHEDLQNVSQVERQIRGMLSGSSFEGYHPYPVSGHKVLENVDSVTDVYTYLTEALVPMFFTGSGDSRDRILRLNKLIGGVHMQQTRREAVDCAAEYPKLGPHDKSGKNPLLVNFSCYPMSKPAKECFGPGERIPGFCSDGHAIGVRRLSAAAHAAKTKIGKATKSAVSGEGAGSVYSVSLLSSQGLSNASWMVETLKNNSWIDLSTSWIGIRTFSLNPDLGVYSSALVNFFIAPSGEIVPFLQVSSFTAGPYRNSGLLVVDIVWLVFWAHVLFDCCQRLLSACRKWKTHWRSYIMNVWTWLDWLCVTAGVCIVVIWIMYLARFSNVEKAALKVYQVETESITRQNAAVRHLQKSLAASDDYLDFFRVSTGWYIVLISLRFFRGFSTQPRLAVVTETIFACVTDLIHFLMVFLTLVFAFSFAGMFLFGHRLINWSSFSLALKESLLILIGSFEFAELALEHPVTAMLWFSVYIVLLFLVMVNMCLAIVMDRFSALKSAAAFSHPVWTQLSMVARDRFRKGRVPETMLVEVCERLDAEMVGKKMLLTACPSLGEGQAKEIIDTVATIEVNEDCQLFSITDATKLVVSIKDSVSKMAKDLNWLTGYQKRNNEMMVQKKRALRLGASNPSEISAVDLLSKMALLEKRLDSVEGFVKEMMSYIIWRGREVRNRLSVIESVLLENLQEKPDGGT